MKSCHKYVKKFKFIGNQHLVKLNLVAFHSATELNQYYNKQMSP